MASGVVVAHLKRRARFEKGGHRHTSVVAGLADVGEGLVECCGEYCLRGKYQAAQGPDEFVAVVQT
jgi:hypothetical protein